MDRVSAAAKKRSSEITSACDSIMPSPTPGKMYALLPCPGINVLPSISTLSKGLPLANKHFFLVHLYASSAVHSDEG